MLVERRNGKRFHAQIGAVFNDQTGLNFCFITNLSRSGAYLNSKRTFGIGSHVMMQISNGSFDAPVEGRIVRIDRPMRNSHHCGMGVSFDHLSPAAKRLRDDLLLYLMGLKYHNPWN